ncbi:MAG: restriction endonuclease subunit S [Methylomonas sp.]|nr:restriction endonuclease subunit S [Methylomonas sp.]
MKYAAYSKYKTSPMAWLDKLPTHWSAASLRWMSKRYAGGTPDKGNEAYWEDGDIPWINSGAVNDGYITQPSELITRVGFANSSAKWIPKDALVMALAGQGKTKVMVAQLGIPTTCNQSMAALIPDHLFAPRYLYYWLTANYQNIRNLAGGEARDGLNLEMLGSIPCPLPPIDEQQTIARFLDAKTAQIDDLIAKKRQLIAKLKEKRSALIARTVTRGLPSEVLLRHSRAGGSPDESDWVPACAGTTGEVQMKDSGVEWLGTIPSHWATPPLYARYSVELGKMLSEAKITGEHLIPYLRNVDVQWNVINYQDLPEMDIPPAEYPRYTIRAGDLLVCEGGEVGRAAIVGRFDGVIGYQKALHKLRALRGDEDQRFMCFILEWATQTGVFKAGGMSTIAHLTGEQLRKYRFPKPPKNEQQVIVQYLQRETNKIGHLQREVEAVIDRLTEYRQTLITSAVTGKIDVRKHRHAREGGHPEGLADAMG